MDFEDEEIDEEFEQMMEIVDCLDSEMLFDAIKSNNFVVLDFVEQNIQIEHLETTSTKDKAGFTLLHLAAEKELTRFCKYLIQQDPSLLDQVDAYGNTALHWAIFSSDNWELVDYLLLAGANINLANEAAQTPFLLGCILGRLCCIRSLVLQGANLLDVDENVMNGLHLASLHGRFDVIKFLLRQEGGPKATSLDANGNIPLHLAARLPNGNTKQLRSLFNVLIKNNPNLDSINSQGRTPLFSAISAEHSDSFDILVHKETSHDIQDHLGRTLLHYAAYCGNETILQVLCEEQVELNAIDHAGCTALHACVSNENMVSILLENGANPLVPDQNGRTPLHFALMGGFPRSFLLLSQYSPGLDPNMLDQFGRTLLHYCCRFDLVECLAVLRALGGDESKKDPLGHTLIHYASHFGATGIISNVFSSIRKHKLSSYLTGTNRASQKPLHLAAANSTAETCQLLLDFRASPWAPDKSGCTAVHYASLHHNMETLELLMTPKELNRIDKAGAKAFHYAALSGDVDVAEFVLNVGSEGRDTDLQGRSAIFYASNMEMVQFLSYGLDAKSLDKQNRNFLFACIQLKQRELFAELVEGHGYDIQHRDKNQITLLHHAAYCGDVWFVQYILDQSSLDAFVVDNNKWSPVHYACFAGHEPCLRILLNSLSIDCQERVVNQRDSKGRSPLDAAAFGRHKECIFTLTRCMDPSETYEAALDGRTPLHVAVHHMLDNPDEELLHELLQFFDVQAKDRNGRTALHRTVYHNLPHYTSFLLDNGADVNAQDVKGRSVTMFAAYLGYEEILDILATFHPDITLTDCKGKTAADYSTKREKEAEYISDEDKEDYVEEEYEFLQEEMEPVDFGDEDLMEDDNTDGEMETHHKTISPEDKLAILQATSNDEKPTQQTTEIPLVNEHIPTPGEDLPTTVETLDDSNQTQQFPIRAIVAVSITISIVLFLGYSFGLYL